jgi:taurine dioxygenase
MHAETSQDPSPALQISVQPFCGPFGAQVLDVDASREFGAATTAALKTAIDRHLVVVLRDQKLTAADLVRYTASYGEVSPSVPNAYLLPEEPRVTVLSNILDDQGRNIGLADAGPYWHTDGLYYPEPHAYTLLYALEIPMAGDQPLGDTQFVSTAAAYDALPEDMKMRLDGMQAVHNVARRYAGDRMKGSTRAPLTAEQRARNPDRIHPVIRTHPRTGRKCIYVDETYTERIVGLPPAQSDRLLADLLQHCVQPQFYHRHQWRVGDLVVWDNCAMQHKSTFDYALPQRRLMYRTTVQGSIPR